MPPPWWFIRVVSYRIIRMAFILSTRKKEIYCYFTFLFRFKTTFTRTVGKWSNQCYDLRISGFTCPIQDLWVRDLLPQTEQYITYEGSTTLPGCWETTTWILSNKPIYLAPGRGEVLSNKPVYLAPAEVRSSATSPSTWHRQR